MLEWQLSYGTFVVVSAQDGLLECTQNECGERNILNLEDISSFYEDVYTLKVRVWLASPGQTEFSSQTVRGGGYERCVGWNYAPLPQSYCARFLFPARQSALYGHLTLRAGIQ